MAEGGYMVTFTTMVGGETRVHVWNGPWIIGRLDYPTDVVRSMPEQVVRDACSTGMSRRVASISRHPNDPDVYYVALGTP